MLFVVTALLFANASRVRRGRSRFQRQADDDVGVAVDVVTAVRWRGQRWEEGPLSIGGSAWLSNFCLLLCAH